MTTYRREQRRKATVDLEVLIAPGRTIESLERWVGLHGETASAYDKLAGCERDLYQYETTAGGRRSVSRRANEYEFTAETHRILGRICYAVLKEKR